MTSDDSEMCELMGGRCDGVRGAISRQTKRIRVPTLLCLEEFHARTHDDFIKFVEEWDGPRDEAGFPRPPIGVFEYERTDERTSDGAAIFRPAE